MTELKLLINMITINNTFYIGSKVSSLSSSSVSLSRSLLGAGVLSVMIRGALTQAGTEPFDRQTRSQPSYKHNYHKLYTV